ncbi:MAG: SGNH/GDSL hydrolase family protein [Gammaproteobacteria bacterium]|nr:SGNH/GDSL hydrolase family protein [Gammaproteobacteria bacterium]
MHKPKACLYNLLLGMLLLVSPAAMALPLPIFILGDSLADNGNAATAVVGSGGSLFPIPFTGPGIVPSAPYAISGRFSNGPIWVDYFSAELGVPIAPALLGGTNFAFGGANSGSLAGVPDEPFIPSLRDQADLLLAATGGVIPADSLVVVFGGGNDIRDAAVRAGQAFAQTLAMTGDPAQAQLAAQFAAQETLGSSLLNFAGIITDLVNAGARNLLVANAPDLGLTPEAQRSGVAGNVSELSLLFNQGLEALLLDVDAGVPSLTLNLLDIFGILNDLVAAAPGVGLNVSDPCVDIGSVCGSPEQYLFWDGIHPTTTVHQILAREVLSATGLPLPGSLLLIMLGLVLLRPALNGAPPITPRQRA